MRNWLAVPMIVAIVAGCAHNKSVSNDYKGAVDSSVHIENHHWGDVNIFLLHDGLRTRLGTVTAASDATFAIPWRMIGSGGQLQLEAHAIALPGALDSETMSYRAGMQINWTLETNLERATLSVY
jgi:hypothetical protein